MRELFETGTEVAIACPARASSGGDAGVGPSECPLIAGSRDAQGAERAVTSSR